MKDKYREGVVKENMENAKGKYVSCRPGYNRGQYYAEAFNIVWRAYDAYLNSEFPNRTVQKRLDDFVSKFLDWYKEKFDNFTDTLKDALEVLSANTVSDMTPGSNKPPISVQNKKNLKEVIDVIYRIRCNLEHGGKQMSEEKNINLVENSFYILYEIIDSILHKEKVLES